MKTQTPATALAKYVPVNRKHKVVILRLPKYLLRSRFPFNPVKPCHVERSRDTYEVS